MRKAICKLVLYSLSIAIFTAGCKTKIDEKPISIKPENCVIILPKQADGIKQFAAMELQKHLKLITGKNIPIENKKNIQKGKYPFYIGIPDPSDRSKLKREEAKYNVGPDATYIYGEDNVLVKYKDPVKESIRYRSNRTGTLYAVYAFLENEFGVKWLEPGDEGIVFKPQKTIVLKEEKYDWIPKLVQRELRSNSWRWKAFKDKQLALPKSMRLSEKEAAQKEIDEKIWLKRMRMGRGLILSYGHTFTKWWEKYGKTHPEYFAMSPDGKRCLYANGGKPDRVKMCVSNKDLQKKLVEEWHKKYLKNPVVYETINVCENDSRGYCHCPECLKLDVRREGEEFDSHMTDRYIYFANEVLKEARKKVPGTRAVMYAYSDYRFPPRKQKVADGLVLGFVPKLMIDPEILDKNYSDWRKAGAKEMFLRPNDMHIDTGLPMGFEKKMFENYKIGLKNGIIGTDYDSIHSYWPSSGIANYILARGHIYPERSFEEWEDEYCSAYGPAENDVKKYYEYWRNVWNNKFMPEKEKIAKVGRYGNFRRGLMWSIPEYYSEKDFDETDAILKAALDKKLTDQERQRLENLILANKHARLTYEAIAANNRDTREKDPAKRLEKSKRLLDFREKHKDDLNINWTQLFDIEKSFGDVSGVQFSQIFQEELTPVKALPVYWKFKMDPEDKGLKDGWEKYSWNDIRKWNRIRTDRAWEQQVKIDKALAEKLKKYDGICWYATMLKLPKKLKGKKIFLTFGAVDESCWVYLNGKEAGQRMNQNQDDWKTPFSIRIDPFVDWNKKTQTLIVRVRDIGGLGGIWKTVWITARD
jgi:hypothetical protein